MLNSNQVRTKLFVRADYLARCSTNKIARLVKLHDAMFNATNCHKNKNENKFTYYLQTISKLTL